MRVAVLDVGSNTVHLRAGDVRQRWALRLAERIGPDGDIEADGVAALVSASAQARQLAAEQSCDELVAVATSTVRDAANSAEVVERVRRAAGVELTVLSGEEEARLIYRAAWRWSHRDDESTWVLVLDIGGGSVEMAGGAGEIPDIAVSLPLGAARLTRTCPRAALDEHVGPMLAPAAQRFPRRPDVALGTSHTFRALARLDPTGPGRLSAAGLAEVRARIGAMPDDEIARLDGVSPGRAHQLVAGAAVAAGLMAAFGVDQVRICPWALREGILLSHGDQRALLRAKSHLDAL